VASFDYLVTIHNKEAILERTLGGVAASASTSSHVIAVLDGCTDRSEEIVDDFAEKGPFAVSKVKTANVHEILSINAGLEFCGGDFVVSLQDDVVLQEPSLERKVIDLYRSEGKALGVVSLRLGVNLRKAPLKDIVSLAMSFGVEAFAGLIAECDHAGHPGEVVSASRVEYGQFVERMVGIKSPVVMPRRVLKAIGKLDPELAPFSYCDHEYCLRAMARGFRNGVFPLRFQSELEWGGTREDKHFPRKARPIHFRNRRYIWELHGPFIQSLWRSGRVSRTSPPHPP